MSYKITEVKLAWTDMGNKMWNVHATRLTDNTKWAMRTWAKDEIDAYNIAAKKLKGADK